jgi:hypothetical protein
MMPKNWLLLVSYRAKKSKFSTQIFFPHPAFICVYTKKKLIGLKILGRNGRLASLKHAAPLRRGMKSTCKTAQSSFPAQQQQGRPL